MGASITLAGESLIAQKHIAQQGLQVARFIFANVPGLDASGPVNRAAAKPAAAQIVYTALIPPENAGYVNPNQVVYSVQVGSDVGDWDFNWIGLETAENVLFAVAYVPTQQKRRNIPPLQLGNNLTRNFLVVFDGAQALTGITIDANTWQHDFTVRLAGIDERERLSNREMYGRACFFGSALQLEKVGSVYQLKTGTAYVEGIRLERAAVLPVVPP
ncbi:MAG: phage tail protein, partial [Pseudomonadaceae bacterium]|nr:phage tail protein [Pseudomonadaceae bacterium]